MDEPAPRHPKELYGKKETANRDNAENSRFRNSDCPYIGYPVYNALVHMVAPQKDHDSAGKAADDKHDTIEIVLSFLIEMSVYEIGTDMPSLSQKPGGCKENDPQQGVFGCLHDPYRSLCKQISHTNRVTDSSRDED
jgi:hypothetical protein